MAERERSATVPEVRRSLAEGWATCPAFRMERSERLAFGSAFHDFVASYWRHLQAIHEESDLTGWSQLAAGSWAGTAGLDQGRRGEFMDLCERFVGTHIGELDTLLAAERPLARNLGWVKLVCTPDRIDRVDNGDRDDEPTWVRLTDYKTELGEMDHLYQVHFYVQMIFLSMPSVERIDVVIDLVRWRPRDPWTIERGELEGWWDAALSALRHRLDAGPGAPVGGPACEGCALRRTCGESLPSVAVAPQTEEEADALLAEHHRLSEAAKVRWGLLEEWYRDRAPRLDVNGEEIGYLETREDSTELLLTASQMVMWSAANGMDPWAFVKAALPKNRGLVDQLDVLGFVRRYRKAPEFKTRKAMVGTRVRRRREEVTVDA